MHGWLGGAIGASALAFVWLVTAPHAQHGGHQHPAPAAPPATDKTEAPGRRTPRRVTMEELHQGGGVPRGWKFAVLPGDSGRGRALFQDLECHKCHQIKDAGFPAAAGDAKNVGPDLTGMGGKHPAEYIAESILAPNHVIVQGPGFTGPDGLSIMPGFADSLSVTQWLDLVAYLKSLTQGGGGDPHAGREVEREAQAASYRIRLVYVAAHDAQHAGHGGAPASPATPAQRGAGHLMAFITDRQFDEPVPYLPVTAIVHAAGRQPQPVRLAPTLSDRGFHYGADVALPARTEKITLAIGATTMVVTGPEAPRFTRPVSAVVEWPRQ
jgi:mono/diheme cytochrome c family protein